MGPQQGRKVFTLQTLPDCRPDNPFVDTVGKVAGFSLHAGVATRAHDRDQLERLCRYITRPAVSTKRLSLTRHGKVRYELKTPYSDGTTHIIFEPLDFIARLAALVPRPRVNLTRYHGVFAPNSKLRALVTPARRGKGRKAQTPEQASDQTPAERRASMTGFCSCKTGIHAIPGNNLGQALETCVPDRYRPLSDFLSFAAPAHPCALKPAASAVARSRSPLLRILAPATLVRPCTSSPVFDYTDLGRRAMPGAMVEKTRW